MSDHSDDDMKAALAKSRSKIQLLPHPGCRSHQHKNIAHLRHVNAAFAEHGLLETAQGGQSLRVRMLEIVDLDTVPAPDNTKDPQYRMTLFKIQKRNERNAMKAIQYEYQDWTLIYVALYECCADTHPALAEEMYETCRLDLRGVSGGYFDGPRCYKMYVRSVQPKERTKEDRAFYEAILQLARDNPLPDNCTGKEYLAKATAFITHLCDNVARPFTPELAGEELISYMPKALSVDGRRIHDELTAQGLLGDLRYVAQRCEEVVESARDVNTAAHPVLVLISDGHLRGRGLHEVSEACGMTVTQAVPRTTMLARPSSGGGYEKFCAWCPHVNKNGDVMRCFSDPKFRTSLPLSIAANQDKVAEIEKERKANAEKQGVTYEPVNLPPQAAIDKFLRDRKARAGGAGRPRPAKAGGAAVTLAGNNGDECYDSFLSSIADFTDASVIPAPDKTESASTVTVQLAAAKELYTLSSTCNGHHEGCPCNASSLKAMLGHDKKACEECSSSQPDYESKDTRTSSLSSNPLCPSDRAEDVLAMLDEASAPSEILKYARDDEPPPSVPWELRADYLDYYEHLSCLFGPTQAEVGARWMIQDEVVPPGAFRDSDSNYFNYMGQRWRPHPRLTDPADSSSPATVDTSPVAETWNVVLYANGATEIVFGVPSRKLITERHTAIASYPCTTEAAAQALVAYLNTHGSWYVLAYADGTAEARRATSYLELAAETNAEYIAPCRDEYTAASRAAKHPKLPPHIVAPFHNTGTKDRGVEQLRLMRPPPYGQTDFEADEAALQRALRSSLGAQFTMSRDDSGEDSYRSYDSGIDSDEDKAHACESAVSTLANTSGMLLSSTFGPLHIESDEESVGGDIACVANGGDEQAAEGAESADDEQDGADDTEAEPLETTGKGDDHPTSERRDRRLTDLDHYVITDDQGRSKHISTSAGVKPPSTLRDEVVFCGSGDSGREAAHEIMGHSDLDTVPPYLPATEEQLAEAGRVYRPARSSHPPLAIGGVTAWGSRSATEAKLASLRANDAVRPSDECGPSPLPESRSARLAATTVLRATAGPSPMPTSRKPNMRVESAAPASQGTDHAVDAEGKALKFGTPTTITAAPAGTPQATAPDVVPGPSPLPCNGASLPTSRGGDEPPGNEMTAACSKQTREVAPTDTAPHVGGQMTQRIPRCGPLRAPALRAAALANDKAGHTDVPPPRTTGEDEQLPPRYKWHILVHPATGLFRTLRCTDDAEDNSPEDIRYQLSRAPQGSYVEYMGEGESGRSAARRTAQELAADFAAANVRARGNASLDEAVMNKCAGAYTCAQEAAARLGEALRSAQPPPSATGFEPTTRHLRVRDAAPYLIVAACFVVLFVAALLGSPHRQQAVGIAIGLIAGGALGTWASSTQNSGVEAMVGRLHRATQGHELVLVMFLLLVYHVVCTRASVVSVPSGDLPKSPTPIGWAPTVTATITAIVTACLVQRRSFFKHDIKPAPIKRTGTPHCKPATRHGKRLDVQLGLVYWTGEIYEYVRVVYVDDDGVTHRLHIPRSVVTKQGVPHTFTRGDVISFRAHAAGGHIVGTNIAIESSIPPPSCTDPELSNWVGGGGMISPASSNSTVTPDIERPTVTSPPTCASKWMQAMANTFGNPQSSKTTPRGNAKTQPAGKTVRSRPSHTRSVAQAAQRHEIKLQKPRVKHAPTKTKMKTQGLEPCMPARNAARGHFPHSAARYDDKSGVGPSTDSHSYNCVVDVKVSPESEVGPHVNERHRYSAI